MKYTLLLTVTIVILYFLLSSSSVYIPAQSLFTYGFFVGNWLALISYSFLHISLAHLIGNIAILLVVGYIAETKLNFKDFFAIYFLSGAVAAIAFASLNPSVVLIGASAAISGLLCCAFFVNFKRAIIFVPLAILILSFLVVPALTAYVEGIQASVNEQKDTLEGDLNETLAKENITETEISILEGNISITKDRFDRGEITEEEYNELVYTLNKSLENKTEELQTIEEQKNKTAEDLLTTLEEKQEIDQGREREDKVKSPVIVHLAGFFTAFAYIAIFRRDILWALPDNMPFLNKAQGKKKPKGKLRK